MERQIRIEFPIDNCIFIAELNTQTCTHARTHTQTQNAHVYIKPLQAKLNLFADRDERINYNAMHATY